MELLGWGDALQREIDAALGHDDKLARGAGRAIFDDCGSGADKVGMAKHRFRALGVSDYDGIRKFGLGLDQSPYRKGLMHDAGALPDLHVLAARLLFDVVAQVAVGEEKNRLFGRNRIDDLNGVARGAEDVRLGLHFDGSIDVTDDDVVGILALEFAYRLDRATHDKTAAGVLVRHDYNPRRIQHFGRLRHEPNTAERNDIAFGFTGFACQLETVADHVRKFLDLGVLVVVRQQNGTAVALELENFFRDSCRRGNHNGGGDCNFILTTVL
jgi:hypothetical protein